jgi:eukaryotic-like serine/threonine-protein kinase
VTWVTGKPGIEDSLFYLEADTAAYGGQMAKARGLTERAVASATHADQKETAALYAANLGIGEALMGNSAQAKQRASEALRLATNRDIDGAAGLALALAGDASGAQKVADELSKKYPEDTIAKMQYEPLIKAGIAIHAGDGPKAIAALETIAPYDVGFLTVDAQIGGPYLRGQANLLAKKGDAAAVEFQKVIDHKPIVGNSTTGALAHLGMARAYAMQAAAASSGAAGGDAEALRAKARTAYQDFLALWKDADADVPVYVQAKAEYAKLAK